MHTVNTALNRKGETVAGRNKQHAIGIHETRGDGRMPRELKKYLRRNYDLYLLLLPGLVFLLVFKYLPLLGNVIAFQDFRITGGNGLIQSILHSKWVGWKHFQRIFNTPDALNAVKNTFVIAGLKILFLFPLPILMALMLNEVVSTRFKRIAQTIIYFPNFLSWVIVGSLFSQILQSDGLLNVLLQVPEADRISFLTQANFFRSILVATDGWKGSGFSTIIYLSAIAAVDTQQYEAAIVDGCNRLQRIWHITLPNIASTIAMVFILSLGIQVAYGSFEQVLIMYNPTVYQTGDILQTFSYRKGLGSMEFSFSTAAGMVNAFCGLVIIYLSNLFVRKTFDKSIW
jgi:putative aldouronate transport system permease protein